MTRQLFALNSKKYDSVETSIRYRPLAERHAYCLFNSSSSLEGLN
jgi:hypothetical protein